jgi:hypothetical protein
VPLDALSIDAADGIVHIRGAVADDRVARGIVEKAAAVPGVRVAVSHMRTPEGDAWVAAGDLKVLETAPRAAVHAQELRSALIRRWPELEDVDIVASGGHIGHLAQLIWARTGEPEDQIRETIDEIVQACA